MMLEPDENPSATSQNETLRSTEHDQLQARKVHGADRRRGEIVEHEIPVETVSIELAATEVEAQVSSDVVAIEVPVQLGERPRAQRRLGGRFASPAKRSASLLSIQK